MFVVHPAIYVCWGRRVHSSTI